MGISRKSHGRRCLKLGAALATAQLALVPAMVSAQQSAGEADVDRRAADVVARMTQEEQFRLLHSLMPLPIGEIPDEVKDQPAMAGYVPGIRRLGIPPMRKTDASLGVTNPMQRREGDVEGLRISGGDQLVARATVRNTGQRAGTEVAQVYLADAAGRETRRLAGFARMDLQPGEARTVEIPLEWKVIADWRDDGWVVRPVEYRFVLAPDALADGPEHTMTLPARRFAK